MKYFSAGWRRYRAYVDTRPQKERLGWHTVSGCSVGCLGLFLLGLIINAVTAIGLAVGLVQPTPTPTPTPTLTPTPTVTPTLTPDAAATESAQATAHVEATAGAEISAATGTARALLPTATPRPTSPPPPPDGMTMAMYNQLQTNTTVEQTFAIMMGSAFNPDRPRQIPPFCEETSRSELAGFVTVSFSCDGTAFASNAQLMYQNDRLISKAQFGLK